MILSIKLWITFGLVFMECSLGEDLEKGIDELTLKLENAFNDLRKVLNLPEMNEKFSSMNINTKALSEEELKNILRKSKSDTEKLIRKTNDVVDKIQSTLTTKFKESESYPIYALDCSPNVTFLYYYRAKALRNSSTADVTNCTVQTLPLTKDPFLDNILTNRDQATTHVPTNVYDFSREIQIVANWTNDLDETFRGKQDDSQLKWQFFCSNTGFFKIYPGIRWNIQIEDSERDNSLVDFFDCRSEQWYLEATAYPKKMLIMVDKSGSMKGRRRIIANHTIYEILNTLTENDFFNILLFTREVIFADNKTRGILMHATDKNKKFILDQLGTVFNPDGIAEYDIGLEASFAVLRNDKLNETGSDLYNYLLMIITDGSPLHYQELIKENNKDVGARIFTYLIGQGATERETVTSMACKNKGYAVEIATLADVKENVQKYLNVIARTNALMRNSFNVWTGVHQMQMQPGEETVPLNATVTTVTTSSLVSSSFSPTFAPNITTTTFSPDITMTTSSNITLPSSPTLATKIEIFKDKPIDLFVTASKAAFDETNATEQLKTGAILGAAGVDISITEFIKTAPFWKIGINAYLFGITSNGFVLFHPKYSPQYKRFIKYFYRNVDISELEIDSQMLITFIRNDQVVQSNDSFQLRTEMLDHSPTSDVKLAGKLSTYQMVDEFKTAFKVERDYYIVGIDKTSYKFGLAVPVKQKVPIYVNVKFEPFSKENLSNHFLMDYDQFFNRCGIIFVNQNETGMAMMNHEFCHMTNHIASLHMRDPLCALVDVMTNITLFNDCISDSSEKAIYINNIYTEITKTAGLPAVWKNVDRLNLNIQQVFSMHHFGLIRYYNYETLTYEHFIRNHSLGIEDPLYQETILVAESLNNKLVLVARPLPNEVVKKNIAPSSLVFTVTTPIVSNGLYIGIIGVQAMYTAFLSIMMNSTVCNDTVKRECFVITESGLILLNNQDIRHNGDLLKEVDCALMESLVIRGIFEEQSLYDFQALCVNAPKPVESFSSRLINPFTQLFRFSLWIFYELVLLIQNLSISSLMWSISAQEANKFDSVPSIEDGPADISVFSTEPSVHNSINNLSPTAAKLPNTNSPPTTKRKHELDVKNLLNLDIGRCSNTHQNNENDWSVCVQKAVSETCRRDKSHAPPQNDPHVGKVTSTNAISHCITACLILQSDYPKVWQEQDDCKQPLKLCHEVSQTFTSIFPSSVFMKPSTTVQPTAPESNEFPLFANEIKTNSLFPNEFKEETPPLLNNMKSGVLCKSTSTCTSKNWFVKSIRNTNLLLVVVDKPKPDCSCDCSYDFGKSRQFGKSQELTRKVNQSIENPYIVKPFFFKDFVNFTKWENATTCTDEAQRSSTPQILLILLSAFLSVFIEY